MQKGQVLQKIQVKSAFHFFPEIKSAREYIYIYIYIKAKKKLTKEVDGDKHRFWFAAGSLA